MSLMLGLESNTLYLLQSLLVIRLVPETLVGKGVTVIFISE